MIRTLLHRQRHEISYAAFTTTHAVCYYENTTPKQCCQKH